MALRGWSGLLAAGVLALAAPAAGAPWRAALPGELVTTPDGGEGEIVRIDQAVAQALLDLPPGASVPVADWPVAPGTRQEVELARYEVYAPDARIVKIEGGRAVELPRSRLVFFQGQSLDDPGTRLVVSIDPETRLLSGMAMTAEGPQELRAAAAGGYLVSAPSAPQEKSGEPAWTCGQQQDPVTGGALESLLAPTKTGAAAGKAITSLHSATIAVDTDNELMSLKFGNNTAAATNYIANLIARMNVMYERDFLVRLAQGFTVLRVSTTADPYNQSGTGAADSAKLNEFSNYWAGGCGGTCNGVSRALAMMLSGKQSSSFSASGIAWLDSLCSGSTGYSFTQVFKFAQDTSANDAYIVGHELGHNFGSPHTHCYSPPIDTCFRGEACYTGSTSCPAPTTINGVTNVTGTVMSYCHLSSCGAQEVFHPRTVELVAPKIQSRVGLCIQPLGPPSGIFSNGFESGGIPGLWSGKTP
ncbi:MAG TPA: M12 family metallo-peptidase [Thermoanaerobaculia bacterium]